MKYTVSYNHFEGCVGLFESRKEAEKYIINQTKREYPAETSAFNDEDCLEFADEYTVMEISI